MTTIGLTDLLELSARGTLYPPTSRYHDVETTTLELGGRTIVYLRRRFVPPPDRFAVLREHVVAEGDRPDTLAARYLGDAEQSWRLCDANVVMRPAELTDRVGRIVLITLPEGIPGATGG
jgi:hypothetical protein